MKKVMFLIPNLNGGGAEKVLLDIINKIDSKRFEVTLILLNKNGVYLDKINKNITIKYLIDEGSIKKKIQKYIITIFPKLYYKIKIKEKFDVEIAFLEGLATKLIANSLNRNSKKIAWVHIDLLKKHWTKKVYFFNGEERAYSKFNNIIFVSEDSLTSFNILFKSNKSIKKVIYNPIISEDVISLSKEKVIKFDKFTIVSIGRLNKQKGYDLLIKAHSELIKKYDYNLVILGDGEERFALEKLINEFNLNNSVKLIGFVKNPYPYIRSANIIISSSRTEGYPLVMLESIVLGKAIVATNVTGNREILGEGKFGIMCDVSVDSIRDTLEGLIKNKCVIEEYELKARNRGKELDYKLIIKEIESLLL